MTAKERLVEQNCTLAELRRLEAVRRRVHCQELRPQAAFPLHGVGPRVRGPQAAGSRSDRRHGKPPRDS
jgi:hypothetical protein